MKILVTGGCGFIGSAVIRHLISHTHHCVINVDKMTYAASEKALEAAAGSDRHCLINQDISNHQAMRDIFAQYQPHAVMHLAAESHVDRSIECPQNFVQTNIVGTYVLLEAAREYWNSLPEPQKQLFRFHHVSTDEVFGSLRPTDPPFTELTPYDPRSPYSASKAASDHLVRAWNHTYGLPTMVSNTVNNYGPWQYPEKLVPVLITRAIAYHTLPIYGVGLNKRDWIYVDDHAAALLKVLEVGQPGSTYAIGARQPLTNLEVAHKVCMILDQLVPDPRGPRSLLTRFVADRPGHDWRYEIDPSHAEQTLNWKPAHDFDTGIEKTIKWHLNNQNIY